MKSKTHPKVTLVGAGRGSEDPITIRGLKDLREADIVLYDVLISEELLARINASTPKIYVGKHCSEHSFTQDDIHPSGFQGPLSRKFPVFNVCAASFQPLIANFPYYLYLTI